MLYIAISILIIALYFAYKREKIISSLSEVTKTVLLGIFFFFGIFLFSDAQFQYEIDNLVVFYLDIIIGFFMYFLCYKYPKPIITH